MQRFLCKRLKVVGLVSSHYLFEVYLFVIKRGDSTYVIGTVVVVGAPAALVLVRIVISFSRLL